MADLIDTLWEITDDDGDVYHVTFLENGCFKFTNNRGDTYNDSSDTWKLESKSITISFSDGYMVRLGNINSNFDLMEGKFENQQGKKGEWSGKCLTKSKLKSTTSGDFSSASSSGETSSPSGSSALRDAELTDKLEADKLIPAGFGRYADPETGEIVAKMQDGKLVPVS